MITTTSNAGSGRFDRSAHPVTPAPTANGGCVLTIGVFDGFHLGHQQLVARTVLEAGRKHVPAVLMTFDPHPLDGCRLRAGTPPAHDGRPTNRVRPGGRNR